MLHFTSILVLLIGVCAFTNAQERPNIILIMADDLGWGDPSYNSRKVFLEDGITPHPDRGWIQTPNLDAMAANGLVFDRFYSASAVCSPTRASCLTGRNPIRVGVPGANTGKLRMDETTLSEVLKSKGYTTGHFGKWHLGTLTTLRRDANRGRRGKTAHYSGPWHHGYDECLVTESKVPTWHPYRIVKNDLALPVDFEDKNFYGTHYWRMPDGDPLAAKEGKVALCDEINNPEDGDDSRLIVREANEFISRAVKAEDPFFAVVWFHTPHKPIPDPEGVEAVDSPDPAKDCIEDMDDAIGMLRSHLRKLGVHENTMIWFTSDNGPENGVNSPNETSTRRSIRAGGYLERKRSLNFGGVQVPGILEWPTKVKQGRATQFQAVTSDYYPTILDYLQVTVPNQKPLDGISLRPVIEDSATERDHAIGFKYAKMVSWLTKDYLLVTNEKTKSFSLYDIRRDEFQRRDIAAEYPEIVSTLQADLEDWLDAIKKDIPLN
ncbi:MAG: sulfatase-like hydrolase/transferase [Verrucomicrobiota bacterium]